MGDIQLKNGDKMPRIGFGTWKIPEGEQAYEATITALKTGYRHIDTAFIYGNEHSVGRAVNAVDIDREDIFVTTKLWTDVVGYDNAIIACQASLERLGLDYIDLYLIHWPDIPKRLEAWRALVDLQKEGLIHHIGVSNYAVEHLEEIRNNSTTTPEVNQIELHPLVYKQQQDILTYCQKHNILVEAYSPFAQGRALNNEQVGVIAKKHNKSSAQVLVRWALQHNAIPLPKASHEERMQQNINVFDFELSKDDMKHLDEIDDEYRVTRDPRNID